jgi:thioredoxin reductase
MYDAIVIGGSYAGISAALQLARARRLVLVVDTGQRRNKNAATSHGFLGQDGCDPAELASEARAQLLEYSNVTWVEDAAVDAEAIGDTFAIRVAGGDRFEGKRLVLAHGVVDELPDIPGVADRWGRSIFHCPYCHGYELERGRLGVLATVPMSTHQALLLPDWGETTYFTRDLFEPNDETLAAFARRGVTIERTPVKAVDGATPDVRVHLADDRTLSFAGLFLAPKTRVGAPLAVKLGCAFESGPLGDFVQTDPMKETTVRGVFACGDLAVAAGSVAISVGDGARAGVSAHQSLIFR